jgi:hypothetical protein
MMLEIQKRPWGLQDLDRVDPRENGFIIVFRAPALVNAP